MWGINLQSQNAIITNFPITDSVQSSVVAASPNGEFMVVTPGDPEPNQSQTMVSVAMDDDDEISIAWLHRYFPDFPSAETSI